MLRRTAAAVALALLTAACGGDAGGSGGDGLVVYSGRGEAMVRPLIERFERESGVDVEVRYAGTAELAAQLLEEGGNRKADVFLSQDAGALGALQQAGVLVPLPADVVDQVPDRYRADDGTWVATSGRARVIAYNPALVERSQLPRSTAELTDPKWKGKVGFPPTNASFQAFVTAMRVTRGDAETRAWLEGMKANGRTYENNLQTLDAVESGEIQLGLVNHYYLHERIAERGEANVKARNHFLGNRDPGALVNVAGVGIVKGTDKAAEAERFVRFLLSEPAQKHFSDVLKEYPMASHGDRVVIPSGLPPLADIQGPDIDLSQLAPLKETLAMLSEVGLT